MTTDSLPASYERRKVELGNRAFGGTGAAPGDVRPSRDTQVWSPRTRLTVWLARGDMSRNPFEAIKYRPLYDLGVFILSLQEGCPVADTDIQRGCQVNTVTKKTCNHLWPPTPSI
nr:hypothetical protein CFP56_07630 [Quercus suber]